MTGSRTALTVGMRLAYDGRGWHVVELTPPSVLLADSAGRTFRQVDVGHLLSHASTRLLAGEAEDPPVAALGPVIDGLDPAEMGELRVRVEHVLEVLTGFRRGRQALALPDEPRPAYAPGTSLVDRRRTKARELGVSERTVRRMVARYERNGPAGLIRDQAAQGALRGLDSRWVGMIHCVLAEHTEASRPTQDFILARVAARLDVEYGPGQVRVPSMTRAREILKEITKGTSAFGATKRKREIARRPPAPYGRLRPTRPGEYLVLDTTRLDVFAMDPVTLRWVQAELSIALDLYDRCVTGLRLTPVSTKAIDAAAVLLESVRPLPEPAAGWVDTRPPHHGLPAQVILDAAKLVDASGRPLLPSVAAETVIVDHGKIYLSEHLLSVCERLGISVQPARVYQATDKAALERFFRTLGEQLLVALPGYKGPDVYHRGKDVEAHAFYFLDELEQIIRQWVATCYHRQPHAGLCIPEVPGLDVCPLEMFAHGVARAGHLQIPVRADMVFDFLQVEWRTIQHYGVEIGGLRYDGTALNPYRHRTSPYSGRHAGKWPIRVDPGDVSKVYFQDPDNNAWHVLGWEHAEAVGGPFSAEALAYARRLAVARHRFPDTKRALAELLDQWNAGLAGNRAERRMAVRISEQRLRLVDETTAELAAVPAGPAAGGTPDGGDELGGDDDSDDEVDAAFPGEPADFRPGHGDGDFYAEAMETV